MKIDYAEENDIINTVSIEEKVIKVYYLVEEIN